MIFKREVRYASEWQRWLNEGEEVAGGEKRRAIRSLLLNPSRNDDVVQGGEKVLEDREADI